MSPSAFVIDLHLDLNECCNCHIQMIATWNNSTPHLSYCFGPSQYVPLRDIGALLVDKYS